MIDSAVTKNYERWLERAGECSHGELAVLADDEKALLDAFYRDLTFGTGGLRGVLGVGPNRMNVYTVAKATQGLADYLNARFEAPSVAIARDSRLNGDLFMRVAAEVLAANGVRACLYPRIEPTPALSFAVRDLGCSAGICLTASHNPSEYNGYKVYGPDGCQITTQAARDIQAAIDAIDMFDGVRRADYYEAMAQGAIEWIGEGTLDRYIDAVVSQSVETPQDGSANADAAPLSVVYTPLSGTGLECFERMTRRIGVSDLRVVPEQMVPDGRFPTCPYPNPEIREALEKGLELAGRVHPDLLLATDPDADRVGAAAPDVNGEFKLISGNEMGMLLLDYICRMRAARGEDLRDKVVITTIVSAPMADTLADDYGFELRRTLTGFKFIGEQIGLLEARGEAWRFIFGFEESYGYLSGSYVRDKDAIDAGMLICQMTRHYKVSGKSLRDVLGELYGRYGYYRNSQISVTYPGAEGAARMQDITAGLRACPPADIAGRRVERMVDYLSGAEMPVTGGNGNAAVQMLPPSDVLEFRLEGGAKMIVRPSGTEPKMKAYLFVRGADAQEADAALENLEATAEEMLT